MLGNILQACWQVGYKIKASLNIKLPPILPEMQITIFDTIFRS
jgi:hypothetical protein